MKLGRRHLVALAGTLLFHGLLAVVLLAVFLRYDSTAEPPEWPPADSAELIFGGDIVKLGDFSPVDYDEPSAPAPEDVAEAAPDPTPTPTPAAPVATQPSPAKAAPSDAAVREAEAARRAAEQQARDDIARRVAFGQGSGQGATGQPDGTSKTGAVSGVSASGLGNRAVVATPAPPRGPMGKVVVKITVNRAGRVVDASVHSGEGAAGASADSRSQCLRAARAATFSPSETAPERQTGYLTYQFK